VPHQTVLEEVQRGYMLNDKVIRHAKVVVSSSAEQPSVDKFM
jgi:molecular chaperone GrpE (heat shock protein)